MSLPKHLYIYLTLLMLTIIGLIVLLISQNIHADTPSSSGQPKVHAYASDSIYAYLGQGEPAGYKHLEKKAFPFIESDYPSWFAPGFESENLEDWLQLLPAQDRNGGMYLIVPRVGAIVPVTQNEQYEHTASTDTRDFIEQLQGGAVHHAGTEMPGQRGGNFAIAGHTSYGRYFPGRYKTVFQFIPFLESDDQIHIYIRDSKGTRKVTYRVFRQGETEATDLSILDPVSKKDSIMTVYGCYPFGTRERRTYAQARRVLDTYID